jgi:hypothetical protein
MRHIFTDTERRVGWKHRRIDPERIRVSYTVTVPEDIAAVLRVYGDKDEIRGLLADYARRCYARYTGLQKSIPEKDEPCSAK